ncbi:MAG: hypothetical protein IH946_09035 [Bacteroidetes bacterium]|nr:hypothetical protein [Bacteroidota bacterium]
MDSGGHLQVMNTGESVFIGEGAGANDYLSSNKNVFVCYYAGNENTEGEQNTAIGYYSMRRDTLGSQLIAINGNFVLKFKLR